VIRIIVIGKKHEAWVAEAIECYEKRLKKPFNVEWVTLPHSAQTGLVAREKESEAIVSRLNANDYVVLLDEKGEMLNSVGISKLIHSQLEASKPIAIIIGGAYGVNETVIDRADYVWSLSKLVFPHQLVRLILAEQLYRSQEIAYGNPYHHE
jgi:23S rRNA (pseudouridine1915-N3)-methyltransferase